MTVLTHCRPTGTLGVGQLPVPGVPGLGTVQDPGAPRRGVAIWLHGLLTTPNPGLLGYPTDLISFIPVYAGTLVAGLLADGWVVLSPSFPEDSYSGGAPSVGVKNDLENDPAGTTNAGTRYLNTNLLWWDHIKLWRDATYPGAPLFPIGFSHGGWNALQLASLRENDIIASLAHCPATIWSNSSLAFVGTTLDTTLTRGMDLMPHALDHTTVPTMVSYGTNDFAAGWAGNTTVTPGSDGVDVATFTGSGTLNVGTTFGMTSGPLLQVQTSNGFATVNFTGSTSNTVTGCTTEFGSGTLSTGNTVVQSNIDQIATNAGIAGAPITRNATADTHDLTLTDVATFLAWISGHVDPLAPKVF